MPEGPSIVILKEALQEFKGKKVIAAKGNAKIDMERMIGLKIIDFQSWGKNFLICFDGFYLKIHLMMFGTYRINEEKDAPPRLSLSFKNSSFNFYTCSIKLIEGNTAADYDWETDIMSDQWNSTRAEKTLKDKKNSKVKVCDLLLNQEIFSGVGNIIKNEVLFRIKVHPESEIDSLPPKKLKELVKEARVYSLEFYEWKKKFELKKHWLIYGKKVCPRCNIPSKITHLGKNSRLTYFCSNCQILYSE